ncbi:MAG: AraC family transcriptional regulator [Gammaproteobacteria bacterium]|nr:AraC family transcriptional regulator [Gammaproteobacteria bacterium]
MKRIVLIVLHMLVSGFAYAESADIELQFLDDRAIEIKREFIDIGKDMHIFERQNTFPDEQRVSVFLTVDVGEFFRLHSLKIVIDNETVAQRDYHDHETDGLEKGAANRVYIGNFAQGEHRMTAFIEGVGPRNQPYKKALRYKFMKGAPPVFLELRLRDKESRLQPEMLVKQW